VIFYLGIELVSESVDVPDENTVNRNRIQLTGPPNDNVSLDQVRHQFIPKPKCNPQIDTSDNETSATSTTRDEELSIDELMAQMKNM